MLTYRYKPKNKPKRYHIDIVERMSLQKSKGLVIGLIDIMTLYSLIKQESATVIIVKVLLSTYVLHISYFTLKVNRVIFL